MELHSHIAHKKKRTITMPDPIKRAVIPLTALAACLLVMEVSYPNLGFSLIYLSCLPVMLIAWFMGWKAGIWSGMAISLANGWLTAQYLPDESMTFRILGISISMVVLIILTTLVTRANESYNWFKSQLNQREEIEAALRVSESQYRTLINYAGDAIFICDLDGHFMDVNEIACQRLGYSHEELLLMSMGDIENSDNVSRLTARKAELLQKGQLLFETSYVRKDKTTFPIELNVRLVDYNQRLAFLSVARDISQRKVIEQSERNQRVMAEALRDIAAELTGTLQLDEVLDRILDNLQQVVQHDAAIILMVENGLVRVARQRGFAEHGMAWPGDEESPQRMQDFPVLDMMAKTRRPVVIPDIHTSKLWRNFPANSWVQSYAGVPIVLQGIPIGFLTVESETCGFFNKEHTGNLMVFAYHAAVAIQNARLYDEVRRLALVDELTKCYNRRGLVEMGEPEIQRALGEHKVLAALLIDVDNFKLFNDQYNYYVGDEVLQTLAQRLRENIRKSDLLCRYGGDEFLILMVDNESMDLRSTAERIRKSIELAPFHTGHGDLTVTVSIGIALHQSQHENLTNLIMSAGEALHSAKQAGRNQIIELVQS